MPDFLTISRDSPKLAGIAADHGGCELKEYLAVKLRKTGHEVIGFDDRQSKVDDDYPDFVVRLARAVVCGYRLAVLRTHESRTTLGAVIAASNGTTLPKGKNRIPAHGVAV